MRNGLLCKLGTGIVDTTLAAKTYIKSVFGATSPQYKQIAKTRFTTSSYHLLLSLSYVNKKKYLFITKPRI
ncbi:MAG: hypothetical protein WCK02_09370 [Bacteroidota bacterium]